MKYPGFWFALFVLVALIVAQTTFSGNSWESQSNSAKFTALWAAVTADTSSGSFPNPLTLLQIFVESMDLTFDTVADDLPYQGPFGISRRVKLIHSVGAIAPLRWRSVGNHPYTGLFTGSNYAFIRFSWAKAPDFTSSHPYLPGVAFKFLRTGLRSIDFMAMTSLLGVNTPNFFANDVTNHLPDLPPTAPLLILKLRDVFAKASKWPVLLGISDMSTYDENGNAVSSPVFPYRLIFHAPAAVRQLLNTTTQPTDFPSFFVPNVGGPITAVYSVWAEAFPDDPNPLKIAELDLTAPLTPSQFADSTMFFQHQRMEEDFAIHPEWVNQTLADQAVQRSFDYWIFPNRSD